jgi:hypothetical protein
MDKHTKNVQLSYIILLSVIFLIVVYDIRENEIMKAIINDRSLPLHL